MPKYKVRYTFEVEVDAPNESIAKINADLRFDYPAQYYLWDYMINKKIIEIDGKSVFDTFENVEKVKPSELYEKRMLNNLVNYTCHLCPDKNKCKYAFDDYCTNGDCLMEK